MLDEIIRYKRSRIDRIKSSAEIGRIEAMVESFPPVVSLKESLQSEDAVSIIAEIKRKSPSRGIIAENINVEEIARIYERAGAGGISVLTEDGFFSGSNGDLMRAKRVTSLPVLRKDFIIHECQIWESREIGADAVLLIVKILPRKTLANLYSLAVKLGLEAVIEVHDRLELDQALELCPQLIGINNRNLVTFETDLGVFESLVQYVPGETAAICESGISCREDITRIQDCGAAAALVGESIMAHSNPFHKICELRGVSP